MKKAALPVVGFMAGLLAGVFIKFAYAALISRPGAPGGEILLPVLILLLLAFGFGMGRMTAALEREWQQANEKPSKRLPPSYSDGYHDGFKAGCVFSEDVSSHERV